MYGIRLIRGDAMKYEKNFGNEYLIENIGYTKVSRDKNFVFPYKNGKDVNSLIILENGAMKYEFSDNTVYLEKGKFLYVPKKVPYIATYLEDNTTISMFLFDTCEEKLPYYLKNPVLRHMPKRSENFDSMSGLDTQSVAFVSARIYDLLYVLEKPDNLPGNKYTKILPAVFAIKKNYFENHKISYYADMCNMSEPNFRKLFREYTGTSPIEYRNLIRMHQAKNMIDSGEFSVNEAAYLAGFNNMSFFYELYNRTFR